MSAPSLALYVHWPFCASKCPYCDFNSHVRDGVDQARWRAALLAEIDDAARTLGRRRATSLFFGGGTPSLAPPATIAAVIGRIADRFDLEPNAEITLEANPTSVEADAFRDLRAAGVNRLSLGVQSLDDAALRFLGRGHDAAQARAAAALAARVFPRWSIDLIYALPDDTTQAWAAMLDDALALAGDHIALYQLTIEPDTGFASAVRRGAFAPAPDALAEALYDATEERLSKAGFAAYEVSNYARPGGECRHNLQYWRYGDYLGVGPGAHGRITRAGVKYAQTRRRAPEAWLAQVEAEGGALAEDTPLTPAERLVETLVMGLRLTEGVPFARIESEAGAPWTEVLAPDLLRAAAAEGLLAHDDRRLWATARGRRVLESILPRLIA